MNSILEKKILTLLFSVFIASIAAGINIIAFPAILIENNISSFFIGITSTIEIIAGVIISLFLSKIIHRIGTLKTATIIALVYSLVIYFIFFYKNFYIWIALDAICGGCWLSLFIIRQSWINIVIKENRSIIIALTSTIFCAGFIIGSFFIKEIGALNHKSLILSSTLITLSIIVLFYIRNSQPKEIDSQRLAFREIYIKSKIATISRFLLSLQVSAIIFFTIVIGKYINISTENSGFLISAFMASGFVDLYAGFLVKKFSRTNMIKIGFIGCLISMSCAMIFYESYKILIAIYFLYGCFSALIFIASLTIINESFDKEKLISANASFEGIGAIGSISGALLGGIFTELFSFYGFFLLIIITNILAIFSNKINYLK